MNSDRLIELLQAAQQEAGKPLPVIMWSAGGVDRVEVGFDTVKQRDEVWLQEETPR